MNYKLSISFAIAFLLSGCASSQQEEKNQQLAEIDSELVALDLQNNNVEAAREHLAEAEALAATLPQVLVAEGYFNQMLGDGANALKDYQQAIQADPRNPDIENQYGAYLYRTGNYQAALSEFREAGQNPQNEVAAQADENVRFAEAKLGQPVLSQNYFQEAGLLGGLEYLTKFAWI